MDLNSFTRSLAQPQAPAGLSAALQALWEEKKGNWDRAHTLVQEAETGEGAWVHAYLHRVEGDTWNAGYWYRKAGKPMPDLSLEEEWTQMVSALLNK